jgi:predicted nucleotidyltransferase
MADIAQKDAILKIISAFYPESKIYLFGSYAQGKQRAGSDIDIAIDVGKRLNLHERHFLKNLLDALPMAQKIDLVDMHSIPEEMHQAILMEGIAWKS